MLIRKVEWDKAGNHQMQFFGFEIQKKTMSSTKKSSPSREDEDWFDTNV